MRAINRIQKLLALAEAGNKAAGVKAAALLRERNLTEADVPPVRGRGRPRIDRTIQDLLISKLDSPPDICQRTKENLIYWGVGLNTLFGEPANPSPENLKRWAWLLRPDGSNVAHARKTIISQLGRIGHEPTRKIYADRLCKLKPKTREAIRLLRAWESAHAAIVVRMAKRGATESDFNEKTLADIAQRACANPKSIQRTRPAAPS